MNGVMSIPDDYVDLFDKRSFWHVATIGPSATPQCSPVWASFDGSHVRFGMTRAHQKFRNIEANPAIALSAIDPDNSYRYLEVRGTVTSIDDDGDLAFINSLSRKYLDQDPFPYHQPGDERVVVTVEPTSTTAQG